MKLLRELALDGLIIAGTGAVVYGMWLAWHPLGFIAAGAAVIFGALSLGTRSIG
jgi:hypothetical protein